MIKCEFCGKEFDSVHKVKLHQLKNAACLQIQASQQTVIKEDVDIQQTSEDQDEQLSEAVAKYVEDHAKEKELEARDNTSEIEEETAEISASKVKSNKSWEKKVFNEKPWQRTQILKVRLKPELAKKYDIRFVTPEKLDQYLDDEYVSWTPVDRQEIVSRSGEALLDSKQTTGVYTKRGMILLKAPKHEVAARNREMRKENKTPEEMEREIRLQLQHKQYGNLGYGQGIKTG